MDTSMFPATNYFALSTRADKCLPTVLVDLAIAAGVESTLPVRPAPRQPLRQSAAPHMSHQQSCMVSHARIWRPSNTAQAWAKCTPSWLGASLPHS